MSGEYEALEDELPPLEERLPKARRRACTAGIVSLCAAVTLAAAIAVPGWSGFGKVTWKTPVIDGNRNQYTVSTTLSMAWATICLEEADDASDYIHNHTVMKCGVFPAVAGQCVTTDINSALMDMCYCPALCPTTTPGYIPGSYPYFCDRDSVFLDFIYPTFSSMMIFAFVIFLEIIGTWMVFSARRDDHLKLQVRVGCCRMSQGAYSLFCVAAVFQGLGMLNYLIQKATPHGRIQICGGRSGLPEYQFITFGYGFIIAALSWAILAAACHYTKLVRDVQEDIPMPEVEGDEDQEGAAQPSTVPPPPPPPPPAAPPRAPPTAANGVGAQPKAPGPRAPPRPPAKPPTAHFEC